MNSFNKAVFLDRDGTINVDFGYVYQKEKLVFIDGVFEGLKALQDAGYLLVIVTNQSGIARGYFTLTQMEEFHQAMFDELSNRDIHISKIYYCPHLSGCNCRKPKLELFYRAKEEFNIDFSQSFVIGDKIRDLSLCEKENIKGFLIAEKDEKVTNDKIMCCKNLLEAANIIISK